MPVPDRRTATPAPGRPGANRDMSRPLPAALSWGVLIAFVLAFALAIAVMGLPWWMPALYVVMSAIAFATYAADKSAARRARQRVSEQTLLVVGLLGGWPGALVAQQVFRHKTRKRSFRREFWGTVVVNVLALTALIVVAELQGWSLEFPWFTEIGGLLSA